MVGFFTIFGTHGTVMVQGGVILIMLMMEGHVFYCVNRFWGEVWVNLSSMLELTSLGQSVIYILTLHPYRCAESKEASD